MTTTHHISTPLITCTLTGTQHPDGRIFYDAPGALHQLLGKSAAFIAGRIRFSTDEDKLPQMPDILIGAGDDIQATATGLILIIYHCFQRTVYEARAITILLNHIAPPPMADAA